MAVPDARDGARSFVEDSYFTYLIPFATHFDIEKVLQQHGEGSSREKLDAVEQRDSLFFDETVDVHLVLRAPYVEEKTLRTYLRRIAITVEAQIVNAHTTDRDGHHPASEYIYNGTVADAVGEPLVIADEESEESDDSEEDDEEEGRPGERHKEQRHVYVVWKVPVFLGRPRIRLQSPSVVLAAAASLKAFGPGEAGGPPNGGYMPSRIPSGLNLLDGFAHDPMLGGVKPRLSAQRVSRVAPVTQPRDQPRPIKGLQSLRLKIYPVVHTRVRFARPNTAPPSPAVIALLEVDFTPFFDCEAVLNKIALSVTDSTVEDLNDQEGMALPLRCVAHDHVTFLYRLSPQQLDMITPSTRNSSRDLDIAISVMILVQPEGPNMCTPRLTMSWTTSLDFTLPVNPGFGQPMTQPIQRAHRPSQLSIGGGGDGLSLIAPSVSRPDALPSLEAAEAAARSVETSLPDFGITMTFSGPEEPVHAGEEFRWTVFVVNRSKLQDAPGTRDSTVIPGGGGSSAMARKLALRPIPKGRRRNDLRVIRPPSISGAAAGRSGAGPIADAVLDENVVHAMQRSSLVDATEVVCLSADVRVGPLAPNACAVVELRFLALKEGVVGIDMVQVTDLGSKEHVDIRELPVVVVRPRPEESWP